MTSTSASLVRSSVVGTAVLIALVFIPAGTLAYWQGWAYVAVAVVASGAYTAYLAKYDPALLKRRTQAGISHEREPAQKIIISVLMAAFIALVVLPPLDVRFGTAVPWTVSIIGDAFVLLSFYVFYLVSKVNTFAAANVRVEEGQRVITTGLYGYIRHPMYLGALFLVVGTPLALGSWRSLLLVPLFLPVLYFRIANEEEVLTRDLPGYAEYTRQVRYRLLPYIW